MKFYNAAPFVILLAASTNAEKTKLRGSSQTDRMSSEELYKHSTDFGSLDENFGNQHPSNYEEATTYASQRERKLLLKTEECDKRACGSPPTVPVDDELGKELTTIVAGAALDVGSTLNTGVALSSTGFKLFTEIFNSVITNGDSTFSPLADLKDEMLDFIEASNENQDIRNQVNTIARKLRSVKRSLDQYNTYLDADKKTDAEYELKHAQQTCENLHDFHSDHSENRILLRSRLSKAMNYCSLCSYVWTISREWDNGDMVIKESSKNHLQACAYDIPGSVVGAIHERMKHIPESIDISKIHGGENGDTSKVCNLLDWDGYFNYVATDGGNEIVKWMGKGICSTPVPPEFAIINPALVTGTQVECPATDGNPGTIGHEADRCVRNYRVEVFLGLWKLYQPIIASSAYWKKAQDAFEATTLPANDLATNPLKHNGHLFGKGYVQYDKVEIQKYEAGLEDVKHTCHTKCVTENLCTGFGYSVGDRFDGRGHGNCYFMTDVPQVTTQQGVASAVPAEFGGYWVKKQPGLPLEDFIKKTNQDLEILWSGLVDSLNFL